MQQQKHENVIKRKLDEFKAYKKLEGKDFRRFEMIADFTNANTEFYDKWGVVSAPLYHIGQDNITPTYSTHKGYFKFDKETNPNMSTTKAFSRLLSNGTIALPHEEAFERINKLIQNFNKSEQAKGLGGLYLDDDYEAHKGFTHYWQFLSEKEHDVQVGDTVQFGISFRNGIGKGVSLGGDLYSYRLSCSNGAVCRDLKLGSFSIPHIVSAERMLERLTDAMVNTIESYTKLLDYYKAFSIKRLDQQLVNKILKKVDLPLKYLPEEILEITTKKDNKDLEEPQIILRKSKNFTVWDLFNGITQPLTQAIKQTTASKRIEYSSFSEKTTKLHKAIIPLLTTTVK